MDRKTRKILTLNRCLHPRISVARIYMKRRVGGRGLISTEECITADRRGLHDYLKESKGETLSGALEENVIEDGESKRNLQRGKKEDMVYW